MLKGSHRRFWGRVTCDSNFLHAGAMFEDVKIFDLEVSEFKNIKIDPLKVNKCLSEACMCPNGRSVRSVQLIGRYGRHDNP